MSVRELRSQEAQHDSGLILRSAGREAMQIEYQGRTLTIPVELLADGDLYYLPSTFVWDDGTPVAPEVVALIEPVVTEVENFWGLTPEFTTRGA
jgi:hypothetical protein